MSKTNNVSDNNSNQAKWWLFDGKLRDFVIDNNIHWYVASLVIYAYLMSTYSISILSLFDKTIVLFAAKFESNVLSIIAVIILLSFVITDIIKKLKNNYQFNRLLIFAVFLLAVVLLWCRFSNHYKYIYLFWKISYVDILMLVGVAYICTAKITHIKNIRLLNNESKMTDSESNELCLLSDMPISDFNEDVDIFNYDDEVKKVAKEICNLNVKKTWSAAIIAPWGTGKSSFINMMKKYLKDDYNIVLFNPRDSKSCASIQEDFFTTLANMISKYDSRCTSVIEDYMASLQLIDNRKVFGRLLNLYHIWDKNTLKDKLQIALNGLKKRVVVIIDDFDRLSKEEIFEVLKLIDSNAQFKKLVFITAFDSEQVAKIVGEDYKTKDAAFIDKFFNYEYVIPMRSYKYISDYLYKSLIKYMSEEDDNNSIKEFIENNSRKIQKCLPTIRDVKRFVNQIYVDYQYIKGDVYVDEFIGVELIKYKYKDEYNNLYNKKYTKLDKGTNVLHLIDGLDQNMSILPIIEQIFPIPIADKRHAFRHIYDLYSFDNYFVNRTDNELKMSDIDGLFVCARICDSYTKIDEWIKSDQNKKDIEEYISMVDVDSIKDVNYFRNFACVVTYYTVRIQNSSVWDVFINLFNEKNFDYQIERFDVDASILVEDLFAIINNKNYDSNYALLVQLYKSPWLSGSIFRTKKQMMIETIRGVFTNKLNDRSNGENAYKWLENCLDCERHDKLDKLCCSMYKDFLYDNPDYYIKNFIVNKYPNNDLCCLIYEPYCVGIFGDWIGVEEFLLYCKRREVNGANNVYDFWRLIKANKYGGLNISYENGSVQELIDKGFDKKIIMLNKLESIKDRVDDFHEKLSYINQYGRDVLLNELISLENEVNSINLYINLKTDIEQEILNLRFTIGNSFYAN